MGKRDLSEMGFRNAKNRKMSLMNSTYSIEKLTNKVMPDIKLWISGLIGKR